MEYKFRAFIPQLNIMLYNVDVYANGTIGMTTDKLILPADYYIDWDSSCIMQTNPDEYSMDCHVMNVLQGEEYIWFEEGQYKLMQWTGLFDKRGVQIYTSDILKSPSKGAKLTVKYNVGSFIAQYMQSYVLPSNFYLHEVIGNIYENPELLSAK